MRRGRRSTGGGARAQTKSATEVVSLVDDDIDDESTNPPPAAGATTASKTVPPGAAAAQPAAAKDAVYNMEYEFPSSDDEPAAAAPDNDSDSDWEQPTAKQKPKQQTGNTQRRRKQQIQDGGIADDVQEVILQSISKRSSSKRPAGIAAGGTANKAAAAVAASGNSPAVKQPASKRAKTATKAPTAAAAATAKSGAAAGARKGPAGRPAGAAKQAKQTTLQLVQSKGFGSLCFSASQPSALSQNALQLPTSSSQGATASAASQQAAASQAAAAAGAAPAAPAAASSVSSQWSDRHEPCRPDELVVHKRKVAEMQAWLQLFLDAQAAGHCPTQVLLVTGPPGCGKSVTLHVLAESMGFELTEWHAPVPTLWQDYQYQAGAGVGYSSKLDEFDLFVARCKFAALPLTCSAGSKPQSSHQQQQRSQIQQPSQQQLPSLLQSQQMLPPKRRLPQLLPQYQQAPLQQQQQLPAGSQQDQQQQSQAVQQQPSSQPADQAPTVQQQSPQSQQQPSQQQQQQLQSKQPRLKTRPKVLLVDDLPYVGDNARRARLAASLADLASTARCPVVVVATTEEGASGSSNYSSYGAAATGMTTKGLHKDLLAVLEHAGATTINFNPITANTITKALQTIADKEGFMLDPDTVDGIAQAAAGDLRNAIQSLQMLLLRQQPAAVQPGRKGKAKAARKPRRNTKDPEAVAAAAAAKQKVAGQVARDQHLSVYHAVGKLLHHKRQMTEEQQLQQADQPGPQGQQRPQDDSDVEVIDAAAPAAVTAIQQVKSSLWRPPLQLHPEAIIQGSGLEALQVTAFLAENYPHFFAEDSMEQAATAAAYLSDAGYLACHRSPVVSSSAGFWNEDDTAATTLQASAASSIAARGLLFANTHPAPSRWLPLRGPSCFAPDKAAAGNLQRLGEAVQQLQDSWQAAGPAKQQAVIGLAGQLLHSGRQERAAQVLPYLQLLARQSSRVWIHSMLPRSRYHVWNGAVTEQSSSHMQEPQATAALQAAVATVLADKGGGPASSHQMGTEAVDDDSLGASEEIESDDG